MYCFLEQLYKNLGQKNSKPRSICHIEHRVTFVQVFCFNSNKVSFGSQNATITLTGFVPICDFVLVSSNWTTQLEVYWNFSPSITFEQCLVFNEQNVELLSIIVKDKLWSALRIHLTKIINLYNPGCYCSQQSGLFPNYFIIHNLIW